MYSEQLKRQVVREYEAGASIESLRRKYQIGGKSTIQNWIKKYRGFEKPLNELPKSELEKMLVDLHFEHSQQLEKTRTELKQAQLRIAYLESMVGLAEDLFGVDLKKKFAGK